MSEPPVVAATPGPARAVRGALVTASLAVFVLLSAWAAREDSVTVDEFVHLPLGLHQLTTLDFSRDPRNPPLARLLFALPLLPDASVPTLPPDALPHQIRLLGYGFEQLNRGAYHALYVRARWVAIAMATALAVLVWHWAARLYGPAAGLAALFALVWWPDLLAHGHLLTLDVPGALTSVLAAYGSWHLLVRPSLFRALALGAAVALATLVKASGVVCVPAALLCITASAVRERRQPGRPSRARWLALGAAAAASALLVLNAGYLFQGTLAPLFLADLYAADGALAALIRRLPGLRLPLPRPFILGIDEVMNAGRNVTSPTYFLAGELSAAGWWYYHLAAFAFKTPLPLLAGSLLAVARWGVGRSGGARDYCVFFPVLLVFAFNSLFNSLYIGVRHLLPTFPLLCIGVAPLITAPLARVRHAPGWRDRLLAVLAVAALLWLMVGTLRIAPRFLEFFNEMAGGPANGYRMLVDSNLDWGQDLIRLRRYMETRGWNAVHLAYFGLVNPETYGVGFRPLEGPDVTGPVVVSASLLMGRPYFWYRHGRPGWVPGGTYTWVQHHEPVARVGAMFVYEFP
jgi:hypothetical protein